MLFLRTSLLVLVAAAPARLAGPPLTAVVDAAATGGAPSFEALLQAVLAAALLGASAWWVTGAVLTCLADLLARTRPASAVARLCTAAAERVTPVVVRRLLTAGLTTGLTAGLVTTGALASPASADPGEQRPAAAPTGATPLRGLPLPDRTVGAAPTAVPSDNAVDTVRVRPGDSLWSISADRLPVHASSGRVAAATRALFAANADRLGDDPDLIHPGTDLRLPPAPDREDRP